MNDLAHRVLFAGRRGFRAGVLLFAFWLAASSASATPCNQTNSQKDAWVTQRVDALIRAAGALYENDKAQSAYERVVDDISATMNRCRMAEDSARGSLSRVRRIRAGTCYLSNGRARTRLHWSGQSLL